MKTTLQLLFLFLISSVTITAQNQKDFYGKWTGEDKGEIGFIIFDSEGYAAFETDGQVIGGKEFMMNGEKGKMTYSINMDAKPIEIDLTVTRISSGDERIIRCIAQFIDQDSMLFALAFDADRPKNFDDDSFIKLQRVK